MDEEKADDLAGLEYHGMGGVTQACIEAIQRLLLWGEPLKLAKLLTVKGNPVSEHGFILFDEVGDCVAIKSGFTSGYGGEGPRGLSRILGLLHWHRVELAEIEVEADFIERLDSSALTVGDFERVSATAPLRPSRIWDYIDEGDFFSDDGKNPWRRSKSVLPLNLVDDRLGSIARDFWRDPDSALSKAYRKLEAIVRERISEGAENVDMTGSKLFAKAFHGEEPKLSWPRIAKSECQGRANLFTGAYMAHRNARAHREDADVDSNCVTEFLLLNHLFALEKTAVTQTH